MKARTTIDSFALDALLKQLARRTRQRHFVPSTKLAPYVAWFRQVLVDLRSTPLVVLEIFLVFRVDCVQLTDDARL